MKTYPNILSHIPTDTTPLRASFERLALMVLALIEGGRHRAAMETSFTMQRRLREFCKAEFANAQVKLKLDMLCHKHWRRLVLKELGGARALARWAAAMERCKLRAATAEAPSAPAVKSVWRKTPELMAEELRLKAHARKCAKAYAARQPNIIRDPFKMDSEGQFRLPPLPRICGPRDPEAAWTTPFDIMAYHYDATPVAKVSGYDAPIMIWPHEFEAAESWDYERWLRERAVTDRARTPQPRRHSVVARSDTRNPCLNAAPKYDSALRRNIQAWVPSAPAEHSGMTRLGCCAQTKKEDNGLGPVSS